MKKLIIIQFVLLLAGTIFAWSNFGIEYHNWLEKQQCTTGCAIGLTNPFLTPCFYGAIGFALALILSALIWRAENRKLEN